MKYVKFILAILVLLLFVGGTIAFFIWNAKEILVNVLLTGVCFLLFVLYIGYINSTKDTFLGKLKDAFASLFLYFAEFFAKASYEVGTPSSEKRRQKAESFKESMLGVMESSSTYYTPESYYDDFEGHQKQLKVLGINRELWLAEAYPVWYKSFLRKAYYAKECPAILSNIDAFDKDMKLQKTLSYFGITQEEWDNNDTKILNIIK